MLAYKFKAQFERKRIRSGRRLSNQFEMFITMNWRTFAIVLVAIVRSEIRAQSTVSPVTDFDLQRIQGTWYVVARSAEANPHLVCPRTNWTLTENGINFAVSARNRSNNAPINSDILLEFDSDRTNGVFTASSGGQTVGLRQIIHTDYDKVNIIYGHNDAQNVDVLFLLSRSRRIRLHRIAMAQAIVYGKGIRLWFTIFDTHHTCND